MKAKLEWMNVSYDVEFATPLFDLPGTNTTVLRSLYDAIHPRYSISSQNMHVAGGNLLSDVHVRVTLFNGNGVIDVSVDRMSITFSNLRSKDDVAVCRDCIALSEEALEGSLPNTTVRAVAIKPTFFLELGDGQGDAGNHLSRLMGTIGVFKPKAFDDAVLHPGVNLELESSEEGWNALFHAFRDRTRSSSLILSCQAVYGTEGKVQGLESRVEHLERMLKVFIEHIGLEVPESTG